MLRLRYKVDLHVIMRIVQPFVLIMLKLLTIIVNKTFHNVINYIKQIQTCIIFVTNKV
jgi:hypothetical protein